MIKLLLLRANWFYKNNKELLDHLLTVTCIYDYLNCFNIHNSPILIYYLFSSPLDLLKFKLILTLLQLASEITRTSPFLYYEFHCTSNLPKFTFIL